MKTALDWVNNKTAPAMSQKSQDTTQKRSASYFLVFELQKRNAAKTSNDWFDKTINLFRGQ